MVFRRQRCDMWGCCPAGPERSRSSCAAPRAEGTHWGGGCGTRAQRCVRFGAMRASAFSIHESYSRYFNRSARWFQRCFTTHNFFPGFLPAPRPQSRVPRVPWVRRPGVQRGGHRALRNPGKEGRQRSPATLREDEAREKQRQNRRAKKGSGGWESAERAEEGP